MQPLPLSGVDSEAEAVWVVAWFFYSPAPRPGPNGCALPESMVNAFSSSYLTLFVVS